MVDVGLEVGAHCAALAVVGLLLIEFLGRTAPRAHAAVGGGTGDGRDT